MLFLGYCLTLLVETSDKKVEGFSQDDKLLSAEAGVSLTYICLLSLAFMFLPLVFFILLKLAA